MTAYYLTVCVHVHLFFITG